MGYVWGGGEVFGLPCLFLFSLKHSTSKCLEAKKVLEQLILYFYLSIILKPLLDRFFIKIQLIKILCAFKVQKMYKTRLISLHLTHIK